MGLGERLATEWNHPAKRGCMNRNRMRERERESEIEREKERERKRKGEGYRKKE